MSEKTRSLCFRSPRSEETSRFQVPIRGAPISFPFTGLSPRSVLITPEYVLRSKVASKLDFHSRSSSLLSVLKLSLPRSY